jgi:hypothetical protein
MKVFFSRVSNIQDLVVEMTDYLFAFHSYDLTTGYHYVAFLRPEVYAVPMPTLVGEVRTALVELKHKQTSPNSKPYGNKRDRPNKKIQAKLPPIRKGPARPPS